MTGSARRKRVVSKQRVALAAALVAAIAAAIVVLVASPWDRGGTPARPKAVIVDQLAFSDPNPDFAAKAARALEAAGYIVDYYPNIAVTVEFYRDLPSLGYSFVLLRSHSTQFLFRADDANSSRQVADNSVMLFTTEPYSAFAHLEDQRARRLAVGSYPDRPAAGQYFLINPTFVESSMRGRFRDATIVLMGCGGLSTPDLAKAFQRRGAKDFISWDTDVTSAHTDAATQALLTHLVSESLPPTEAVAKTMAEVGPDPSYGSRLLAFP